ncbi:beta-lactamase family protein [Leucobacter allii]|uniref:Beta-lactamase family protein n=1 Tax=Leucobacter allii TaxID=2932247 RepID=A0ABY4FR98_9MICO|nr:serine hydrolase domain-containing protein [Leucobacter allii]UOQ58808.1 beta-lactamase family protein [Leucobacter allii]
MHRKTGTPGRGPTAAVAVLGAGALLLLGCAQPASDGAATREGSPPPAVQRPAAPEGELPAALQSELRDALEAERAATGAPGAVAGVWIPDEGSWTVALGLADVEAGAPTSTEMSWPIRSITKSYTVTLLLQLVDAGELSLDDTLDEYVDGVTNGDEITLLELANMSSGIADYVDEAFIAELAENPAHVFSLQELNSGVLGKPARFAPGTAYVYTNANTNLLGAVIERVTGQSYAEALDERILEPLGQKGTRYLSDAAGWNGPHAVGYQPDPDTGGLAPQEENPSMLGPAGALFSTLDDGRVWAETLGSGPLLDPRTQELREIGHRIETPPYDLYAVGMGETDGWLGHNGEGLGFTAATFHDPESGASIVVYMNASNLADGVHPADRAFRALAEVLADS